jgi:hypothetical protein
MFNSAAEPLDVSLQTDVANLGHSFELPRYSFIVYCLCSLSLASVPVSFPEKRVLRYSMVVRYHRMGHVFGNGSA